jgi:hypothetical protein
MKVCRSVIMLLLSYPFLWAQDAYPTNEWFEIPVTINLMKGYEEGKFQNRHWSRMVYNSIDGNCYFYEGYLNSKLQIPQTIYGNSLYKIDLEKKIIEMKAISNWKKKDGKEGEWFNDSGAQTPFDRHTYGCFLFVDKLDGILMTHGASGGNSVLVQDTWLFSFKNNKWEVFPSVGSIAGPNSNFENHLMYLPGDDKVYMTSRKVKDVVVYRHTFGTKEWNSLEIKKLEGMQTAVAFWGANGKVDTKRKRFVFIGGAIKNKDAPMTGANNFIVFNFTTESFETLVPASEVAPAGFIRVPYLAYDVENDVYIVHDSKSDIGTWVFNPNDNKWKKIEVGKGPDGDEFSEYDTKRKMMIVQNKGKVFGLKLDLKTVK